MATYSSKRFMEKLKSCVQDDSFSDVIIRTEDSQFAVHRVILSCHSDYFSKQLNGPWKESLERVIEITNFDTSVVGAMVQFMYNFDYTNESNESAMVFDAQVYQIADKYDISALKDHAKAKFETKIKTGWYTDDFPTVVETVYTTTPLEDRGLRDLVVETASVNLEKLICRDGFCQALRTTIDFVADLVPFKRDKPVEEIRSYKCPFCHEVFQFDDPGTKYRHCPRCGSQFSVWARHVINL
ncbi:n-carbamoyl-l-amino acid hydrolase [Fusarium heterosporum]|uniref:N-carbamoyl-l-amino acid hydrolase n=1 Tax=Fusarium heterosporum TaxID=42747 RepID=A0A8H5TEM2_FUSHE|nr:n-carbamoyl-l-amino acid hydrolase [Fusarium heterosporum]